LNTVNPEQAWDKYSDTFWAYLSGFIDGDGCVYLGKAKTGKYTSYQSVVSVSQKDSYILQIFKKLLGGNINYSETKGFNGRFIVPAWRVAAKRQVRYILEKCLPYLIIKKHQAELLIEATNIMYGNHCTRFGALKTPKNISDRLEEIYLEMRTLKRTPLAAVTTKRESVERRCDSLNCTDGKGAELAEMSNRLINFKV
jgi:hypothetical protein